MSVSKKVGSVDIATHIVERPKRRPKGHKAVINDTPKAKRVRGPLTHRPFAEALKGLQIGR